MAIKMSKLISPMDMVVMIANNKAEVIDISSEELGTSPEVVETVDDYDYLVSIKLRGAENTVYLKRVL